MVSESTFLPMYSYPDVPHKHYVKVEPYSIPMSFLKLRYLKTELNIDNGIYAIV